MRLILDDTEVFPEQNTAVKLTRENRMMSSAGEYTMQVTLPMDIAANRRFFDEWQRMDKTQKTVTYRAMLYVGDRCVLQGSAKAVTVTNDSVKVQLYGNRSEFNARHGDKYIDELQLPYMLKRYISGRDNGGVDTNIRRMQNGFCGNPDIGVAVPVYDAANQRIANYMGTLHTKIGNVWVDTFRYGQPWTMNVKEGEASETAPGMGVNWQLLYVVKSVMQALECTADVSQFDREPYNRIYLAVPAEYMKDALPHWTLREFVDEVQRFFSAYANFEPGARHMTLEGVKNHYMTEAVQYEAADDFSVECCYEQGRTDNMLSSNLEYKQSSVDCHSYGFVEDMERFQTTECGSFEELAAAYFDAYEAQRACRVWKCENGCFTQWTYNEDGESAMTHIDVFGKLVRDKDENTLQMRITPAAMSENIPYPIYYNTDHNNYRVETAYAKLPVVECVGDWLGEEVDVTVQDMIENGAEQETAKGKPDLIEIVLVDGILQNLKTGINKGGDADSEQIPMAFTACDYMCEGGIAHRKWSLAINSQYRIAAMADLHNADRIIDSGQKYHIRFMADKVPQAEGVFLFRGKKYAAEKIEANIVAGELDKMMEGYFYRLLI